MLLSISHLFLQTLILPADTYKFLQVPSCQKDETDAETKIAASRYDSGCPLRLLLRSSLSISIVNKMKTRLHPECLPYRAAGIQVSRCCRCRCSGIAFLP